MKASEKRKSAYENKVFIEEWLKIALLYESFCCF